MNQKTVLVVLAIVATVAGIHFYSLDGIVGIAFRCFSVDDARYAPGYSDHKFRTIRNGMTLSEVTNILGGPIEVWMRDTEFHRWTDLAQVAWTTNWYSLQYSVSPQDSSYTRRVIEIQNGKVTGKQHEFYLD